MRASELFVLYAKSKRHKEQSVGRGSVQTFVKLPLLLYYSTNLNRLRLQKNFKGISLEPGVFIL